MMKRAWIVVGLLAAACSSSNSSSSSSSGGTTPDADGGVTDTDAGATPDVELLAVVNLPQTPSTQGLSGAFYDAPNKTFWAIQDTVPRLVPFDISSDFTTFAVGNPIDLTGRPGSEWDGEGLFLQNGEFVAVTVETTPLVERFDADGKYLGKIDLPAKYAQQAAGNKGIESLSIAPSGKYLFAANEAALTTDGSLATKTTGTLVRILRRDLGTSKDEEHAYRTEPLGEGTGGDMGVPDVTPLDDANLLVLERGFQTGYGNTVRIFRVDITSTADVSGTASLGASTPVLAKKLVVDLGTLPAGSTTHPGTQPNPLLDNYESLALGPTLPDGRRVVFVTSDDNASVEQVPRVLVLALRL